MSGNTHTVVAATGVKILCSHLSNLLGYEDRSLQHSTVQLAVNSEVNL
jgi:hypothetical protein